MSARQAAVASAASYRASNAGRKGRKLNAWRLGLTLSAHSALPAGPGAAPSGLSKKRHRPRGSRPDFRRTYRQPAWRSRAVSGAMPLSAIDPQRRDPALLERGGSGSRHRL